MDAKLINWIGGEHEFALDLGALRALQDCCDAGPEQVMRRIATGAWRVNDLYDTIRLGLITSGAMKGPEAAKFLTDLFSKHPMIAFRETAQLILIAALVGVEDDPLGEPMGAETPLENGNSAGFTETAP